MSKKHDILENDIFDLKFNEKSRNFELKSKVNKPVELDEMTIDLMKKIKKAVDHE